MTESSITTETIAAAERLVGVAFTPAERRQILARIDEQIGRVRHRRSFEPDNALGPATVFDPRLSTFDIAANDGGFKPSQPAALPLPDGDDDIAFASVTTLAGWLRRGTITSTRLTEIYLARLESIGAELECAVTITTDLAMRQAAEADREIAARALPGSAARRSLGRQGPARHRGHRDHLGGDALQGPGRRTRRRRGPAAARGRRRAGRQDDARRAGRRRRLVRRHNAQPVEY